MLSTLVELLTTANVVVAVLLFAAATAVVLVVAPRLSSTVHELGERTPLGSSLAGSILLGASTSLPGIIVTVVAALRGDLALAAANAIGGVVAQTTFLPIADIAHRRGDLFESAVSPKALTQLGVLLTLLSVPLFAITGWPELTIGRVHPASLALLGIYVVGIWAARNAPEKRDATPADTAEGAPLRGLWVRYFLYILAVGAAGFVIGTTISPIASAIGLTSLAAGALITAGATSSPELVTAVAAARRGHLDLAVGDVVGGNTFDVLFLAAADLAAGVSLYAQVGNELMLLIAAAILLNALLLLGFARRGGRRTSPESVLMLTIYVVLAVVLVVAPPQAGG